MLDKNFETVADQKRELAPQSHLHFTAAVIPLESVSPSFSRSVIVADNKQRANNDRIETPDYSHLFYATYERTGVYREGYDFYPSRVKIHAVGAVSQLLVDAMRIADTEEAWASPLLNTISRGSYDLTVPVISYEETTEFGRAKSNIKLDRSNTKGTKNEYSGRIKLEIPSNVIEGNVRLKRNTIDLGINGVDLNGKRLRSPKAVSQYDPSNGRVTLNIGNTQFISGYRGFMRPTSAPTVFMRSALEIILGNSSQRDMAYSELFGCRVMHDIEGEKFFE